MSKLPMYVCIHLPDTTVFPAASGGRNSTNTSMEDTSTPSPLPNPIGRRICSISSPSKPSRGENSACLQNKQGWIQRPLTSASDANANQPCASFIQRLLWMHLLGSSGFSGDSSRAQYNVSLGVFKFYLSFLIHKVVFVDFLLFCLFVFLSFQLDCLWLLLVFSFVCFSQQCFQH